MTEKKIEGKTKEVKPEAPKTDKIEISKAEWERTQEQLKMLTEVADKGRVMQYESNKAEKKPIKVKLALYNGGIVVGWRTIKDELVKHPTTGLTVGEVQQYELKVLDKDGNTSEVAINGYPQFSNARYDKRIEVEVVSKSEDYQGNIAFDVRLDDGRVVKIDSRFVN